MNTQETCAVGRQLQRVDTYGGPLLGIPPWDCWRWEKRPTERRRPSMLALMSSFFSRLSRLKRSPLLSIPNALSGLRLCRGLLKA
jgi:hypothetical protein